MVAIFCYLGVLGDGPCYVKILLYVCSTVVIYKTFPPTLSPFLVFTEYEYYITYISRHIKLQSTRTPESLILTFTYTNSLY